MSKFYGRPEKKEASRRISLGLNDCVIGLVSNGPEGAAKRIEISLEFANSDFIRTSTVFLTFEMKNGKVDPDHWGLKKFYERFIDYLGLDIGVGENGDIIHSDGSVIKDVAAYLNQVLKIGKEGVYACYIKNRNYKGKAFQTADFVYDKTNEYAVNRAEDYASWLDKRREEESDAVAPSYMSDDGFHVI